ncbi:MAG: prolyl oligopeptidase family serine peptidase [Terriglobales bacterium]
MKLASLILLAALVPLAACSSSFRPSQKKLRYPVARRDNTVDQYFGTAVAAPYQWMENLSSPELRQWVAAENTVTDNYFAKVPIRGWMQQRLTQLWNYPKETTPQQLSNGMLFFTRNSGLQNQSVVYVQAPATGQPRMLLDPNQLSPDGSVALAGWTPSPSGRYLAYALSQGGSDWETIHVLDVRTGKALPDLVRWVKFSGMAWTHDGKGFFYSRFPQPPAATEARINQHVINQKLYYHRLGQPQSRDRLIFALPKRPEWIVEGGLGDSGRYLFVLASNGSASANELYYADLGNPKAPRLSAKVQPLYTKNDAIYQPLGVIQGTLYLQTTLAAPKGRIVAAKLNDPAPAHWRTVAPQGQRVLLSSALAGGRVLANYLVVAKSRVKLFTTAGKLVATLKLPALGTVSEVSARNDSNQIYYGFTSYLFPTSLYRYDITRGSTSTYFQPKLNFDASPYQVQQVFYPSKDGTKIPMFIVAKKGIKLDGTHPTILYGYGGFDISVTPAFQPMLPVWLELGGVYAVANLRGGGAYGEAWHRAGMLGNKQNVFDDFAWAAKYLIAKGYTSSQHLGIQGYSNGGLLTGASLTQHPELFGAAYIGHGVLDMLRYQNFSGGAYWAPEYGTSASQKAFQWLIKYSPLQNVHAGTCYPPTLITTSWDDDRVVPSHEFKFTAKIQRAQSCANPILLRTTGSTSHIYMPTDKQIAQTADVWAFEAFNLGIQKPPSR